MSRAASAPAPARKPATWTDTPALVIGPAVEEGDALTSAEDDDEGVRRPEELE